MMFVYNAIKKKPAFDLTKAGFVKKNSKFEKMAREPFIQTHLLNLKN